MELTTNVRRRFARAAATYDAHAEAQQRICRHLVEMLPDDELGRFRRVLEIGCGSGCLTRALMARIDGGEWTLNDLCEHWRPALEELTAGRKCRFLFGDAERLPLGGPYDLIASASALQWMRDLPAFLRELRQRLAPGGLLLFNTFTPDNLKEIRLLTGEGLDYPSVESLADWLSSFFSVRRMEESAITLTFPDPLSVLRHLKYTGVTGNASVAWTRGEQARFCEAYRERFLTVDGQVTLTYHPVYVLASADSNPE